MERLDKFLGNATGISRRELKDILKKGRAAVNGAVARDGGIKVSETDIITLDGSKINVKKSMVILLHKPAGVVTSTQDPRDKTVMEVLPKELRHLMPVGRLDKDTEGLLLFTDDGQLAHHLISPNHQISKVYYAKHEGQALEADVAAFEEGIVLGNGDVCLPAKLEPLGPGESRITICQGMYHQVRRMMASRNMTVLYLRREQEGGLDLGDLAVGQWRELTEAEVNGLR